MINNILKPDTVILLEAEKEYMMSYIDHMTQAEVEGTHNNEKDLDRRLAVWSKNNKSSDGSYVFEDFYSQMDIDSIKIKLSLKMKKDPLKSMKIFVERNGKFSNYQSHETEAEVQRLQQQEDSYKEQEA